MMFAFDTNVLTELWEGSNSMAVRLSMIPIKQQALPIVVVEEVLRGRMQLIRQSEASRSKTSLEHAYGLLAKTFLQLKELPIVNYTNECDRLFRTWRQQRLRVSTHDLRIAAICIVHQMTLSTRNRRDFEQVPGLSVEFWD